jgi:Mu transposase-like protein
LSGLIEAGVISGCFVWWRLLSQRRRQVINAYGIKVSRRTYDGQELNPFRQQPSGVKEAKNRWEIRYDPYDVSRIWVRDHWNGGWITVFWSQLHRVAAPFGELAWDHARSRQPGATEEELAGAVADLLQLRVKGFRRPRPRGEPLVVRHLLGRTTQSGLTGPGWPAWPGPRCPAWPRTLLAS